MLHRRMVAFFSGACYEASGGNTIRERETPGCAILGLRGYKDSGLDPNRAPGAPIAAGFEHRESRRLLSHSVEKFPYRPAPGLWDHC